MQSYIYFVRERDSEREGEKVKLIVQAPGRRALTLRRIIEKKVGGGSYLEAGEGSV